MQNLDPCTPHIRTTLHPESGPRPQICLSPAKVRWYSFQFLMEQLEHECCELMAALQAFGRQVQTRLT